MKTKLVLGAIAAAVAVFSQGAFAQATMSASSPTTRAEVKAEAKSGARTPAGEVTPVNPASPDAKNAKSTKTRAERKDETKMSRTSGGLKPAGDADTMKDEKAEKSQASMTNRAERKADTKAAVKSGQTQPAGEAATPGLPPKK